MKLIKCHVENFGKLQNFDHTFDGSFDEIVENNGWGKTTLATFIKAMFYGLPQTTKHKLDENERLKYTPWQGGNFGGYLEFELDGDRYRVERFFGKKEADDTFAITDLATGKPSAKYKKDLGLQLFDLDAEAYERSTFIPQKEIANGINDRISSKLINMIQGTANPESYAKAIKILDDKATALKKKKGSTGRIDDVNAEIMQTSERIDTLKNQSLAIDVLTRNMGDEEDKIAALEGEKQKVSAQIADYGKAQKLLANKKYIDENEDKKRALETAIAGYDKVLNGRQVYPEELKSYSAQNARLAENKTKLKTLEGSDAYTEKYNALNGYFRGNCPKDSDVSAAIKKLQEAQNLNAQAEKLRAEQIASQIVVKEQKPKKKPIASLLCVLLAIVAVVVGCVLVTNLLQVAIVLFVVAVVCLLAGGFMYMKNYIELKTSGNLIAVPTNTANDEQIAAIENKASELNDQAEAFIKLYSDEQVADGVSFLYDMLAKIKQFGELEGQIQVLNGNIQALKGEIADLERDIDGFLANFNFGDALATNQEKLDYLKAVCENAARDRAALCDVTKKLEEFKREHSPENLNATVNTLDIVALQNRERQLQNEINEHRESKNNYANKIDGIRNNLSALDELEAHLDELKAQKDELVKEHKTLKLAMDFLSQANDNLSAKYLAPMKNGINKYLKLVLDKNFKNDFDIDTDMNVSYQEYGKARGLDYLSKGYQEVVDISIRFALVDTLFAKEKPFIILDDPFVNMDKEKIANALKLLRELSKEYQLIYLVCHESRK